MRGSTRHATVEALEPVPKPNSPSAEAAGSLDRLLRGAEVVFSERGYRAANVNEICARSRVGIGTFYAHFEHKRDLLRQVFIDRVLSSGTLTPEHLLDDAQLLAILRATIDDPFVAGLLRAWYEAVLEEPAIGLFQTEWRPQTLRDMAAAVAEAQRRTPSGRQRLDPAVVAWAMATLSREMAIHDRNGAPDIQGLVRLLEELVFGPLAVD